ncbi:MAG: hypothetical protein GX998_04435 [Firmicutes bacterium]|nr:hypothetical protein [Bacillota bacterium]
MTRGEISTVAPVCFEGIGGDVTGEAGNKTVNALVGAGPHSIELRNIQGNIVLSHPPHP